MGYVEVLEVCERVELWGPVFQAGLAQVEVGEGGEEADADFPFLWVGGWAGGCG